jgi:succinate dehydrogenase / fumarate reductase iron-sulfur subunit
MSHASTQPVTPHGRRRPRAPGVQRSRQARQDRLPISEFAFDRAGAASPFGDDVQFPIEPERLVYAHPPADEA